MSLALRRAGILLGLVAAVLLGSIFPFAAALPAARAGEVPLLVESAWLAARMTAPHLRVVDMTSDIAGYRRGHVPGAVHLDVDAARIAVPSGGYRLPSPAEAARLFGRLGIDADTTVVAYDDAGGVHAARLFFTLEAYGHRRAALLDGGLAAWRGAGQSLSRDTPRVAPTAWRPVPDPRVVAMSADVLARLGDRETVLVDTRTAAEFSGRDVRARRGGHIPGAVNVDWREHLRPDGRLKPLAELRVLYAGRGITPDKRIVTYCQTHHRAAHTYFVLRLLGYPRVAGYDRSWAEWGNRADVPVAVPEGVPRS